jgi:hypothetical protein
VEKFVIESEAFKAGAVVILTAGQARSGVSAETRSEILGANLLKVFVK